MRIVSQKMLEAFLNSNAESVSVSHYPPNMSEIEFPTVQEAKKSRAKQDDQHTGEPQIAQVPARIKKRKDLIHIDLFNLIKTQPASSKKKNLDKGVSRVQKRDNTMRYTGNQLDASNPERKRGKMKEVPKKKKVTVLKSAILEARALRRHLRALQEQAMTLTEPPSFDSSATTMQSIGDINTEPQQSQERPEKLLLHSRRFREYCDHSVTSSLNMAVKLLLKDIVKFQDRQYQRDPVKAFAKRRYVIGFREVKKSLQLKKLKLIVIAPDMEVSKTKGGIEDTVEELKVGATAQEVTYLFALSRRELGFLTFKKVGVSCIGICSYDGSEANYEAVMEALSEARTHYNIQTGYSGQKVAVVAPEETTEKKPITVTDQVIASLLQKLSTKCEEKEEMSPFLSAISQSTG